MGQLTYRLSLDVSVLLALVILSNKSHGIFLEGGPIVSLLEYFVDQRAAPQMIFTNFLVDFLKYVVGISRPYVLK